MSMIHSLIFYPEKDYMETPEDYRFDYEDVWLETSDKIKIHGWFLKSNPSPQLSPASGRGSLANVPSPSGRGQGEGGILLFLHGNAGNISHRLFKVKGWLDRGYSVLMVDYRGYGQSKGSIEHEDDIVKDAEAAWKWAAEKTDRVVLLGESLGTYAAIRLAGQFPAKALVLEAPFTSFVDLGKIHYSMVPGVELLLKNFKFSNIDFIEQVKVPVIIIHGTRDEICPYEMAEKLFHKIRAPKEFVSVPGGMHNDLSIAAGDDYFEKAFRFIPKV